MSQITEEEFIRRVEELQDLEDLAEEPGWKAPSRIPTQWDLLLKEMKWMAEDFSSERKWRLKQCKAFAHRCAKAVSKLKLFESQKSIKDSDMKKKRRECARISKEVIKFWKKAEKIVNYKIQKKIEKYKYEILEKHLLLLVDKTEKYSAMLAKDLRIYNNSSFCRTNLKRKIKCPGLRNDKKRIRDDTTETSETSYPCKLLTANRDCNLDEIKSKSTSLTSYSNNSDDKENESGDSEISEESSSGRSSVEDVERESELRNLGEEANMSLEELMAKYNLSVQENCTIKYGNDNNSHNEIKNKNFYDSKDNNTEIEEISVSENGREEDCTRYNTFKTSTEIPFLLKHDLREYQHQGLDWLVTIYKKSINGILADEMGLGKTIMTIALVSWLACEEDCWGPHLIIVPTSVMLQWEMEFKKWCPALKILTYYGNIKERKIKRHGWSKPDAFNICITSYAVILQDNIMFRRKKWIYMILDEAHMIKNWKSQRWQTLLNFNSKRRLLLTGTPLQNDLMELWSLMHFLMPHIFSSHAHFKSWFSNPITDMASGEGYVNQKLIYRLHGVLRPFILRRLKCDVEKQLPKKYEYVVYCTLSKRQRKLYEEYMSCNETKNTLSSKNYLGIVNILMQLRKVCNHSDLFEERPIISPFNFPLITKQFPSLIFQPFSPISHVNQFKVDLRFLNLLPSWNDKFLSMSEADSYCNRKLSLQQMILIGLDGYDKKCQDEANKYLLKLQMQGVSQNTLEILSQSMINIHKQNVEWRYNRIAYLNQVNFSRCTSKPLYGRVLLNLLRLHEPLHIAKIKSRKKWDYIPDSLGTMLKFYSERAEELIEILKTFVCNIRQARAHPIVCWCSYPDRSNIRRGIYEVNKLKKEFNERSNLLWIPTIRSQLFFPDKRLIEYDCGKLQALVPLLQKLNSEGHRVLLFTQMSRMLDILEIFLNIHGYTYMRLDGTTKPEQRHILMQAFNNNNKYFIFILSTRSGGLGVTLTGADTVIFYDSDWNPAIDKQAQDRCHRIGQTREVHIYRLISRYTIEENILKKSEEKKQLDFLAIQSGGYDLSFLQKMDPTNILEEATKDGITNEEIEDAMKKAEDSLDAEAARAAENEAAMDLEEFVCDKMSSISNEQESQNNEEIQDEVINLDQKILGETEKSNSSDEKTAKGPEDEKDDEDIKKIKEIDDLEKALINFRPIDQYAIHFIENTNPPVDVETIANQQLLELEEKEAELKKYNDGSYGSDMDIDDVSEVQEEDKIDKSEFIALYKEEVANFEKLIEEEQRYQEEYLRKMEEEMQIEILEHKSKQKSKIASNNSSSKLDSLDKESLNDTYNSLFQSIRINIPWTTEDDLILCYIVRCTMYAFSSSINDDQQKICINNEMWDLVNLALNTKQRESTNVRSFNRNIELLGEHKRSENTDNVYKIGVSLKQMDQMKRRIEILSGDMQSKQKICYRWIKFASSRHLKSKPIEDHFCILKNKLDNLESEEENKIIETEMKEEKFVSIAECNALFELVSKKYGEKHYDFLRRLSLSLLKELNKEEISSSLKKGLEFISLGHCFIYGGCIDDLKGIINKNINSPVIPTNNCLEKSVDESRKNLENMFKNEKIKIENYSIAETISNGNATSSVMHRIKSCHEGRSVVNGQDDSNMIRIRKKRPIRVKKPEQNHALVGNLQQEAVPCNNSLQVVPFTSNVDVQYVIKEGIADAPSTSYIIHNNHNISALHTPPQNFRLSVGLSTTSRNITTSCLDVPSNSIIQQSQPNNHLNYNREFSSGNSTAATTKAYAPGQSLMIDMMRRAQGVSYMHPPRISFKKAVNQKFPSRSGRK